MDQDQRAFADGVSTVSSGPVAISFHGDGDVLIPRIGLSAVPVSGADLEAHVRACLDRAGMGADD